jgi:hypothetical protein
MTEPTDAPMNKRLVKYLFSILTIWSGLTGVSSADFYQYTFTGFLPPGASSHSQVADGETWTAIMLVDPSVAVDTNPDPNFGVFPGAVVFGSLAFSGGYVAATTDFSGATVTVINDVFADAVRVRGESGLHDFTFQANSETLSTLVSDMLVGPGTTVVPFPDPTVFEFFQLSFDDEFGTIFYFSNQSNNVSLTVTAIPEPAVPLVAPVLAGLFFRRRRQPQ